MKALHTVSQNVCPTLKFNCFHYLLFSKVFEPVVKEILFKELCMTDTTTGCHMKMNHRHMAVSLKKPDFV